MQKSENHIPAQARVEGQLGAMSASAENGAVIGQDYFEILAFKSKLST